jgi:O-acetyl-ADP-ribose deacetylase (regulator of RNase III)
MEHYFSPVYCLQKSLKAHGVQMVRGSGDATGRNVICEATTPKGQCIQVCRGQLEVIPILFKHGQSIDLRSYCSQKETTFEAIVNPANSELYHIGGAAAAIAEVCGSDWVTECKALPSLGSGVGQQPQKVRVGEVLTMGAGDLEQHGVKHIINAVGPRWDNGDDAATCTHLLSSVVRQALIEAQDCYCSSVALNAISTGIFKGPLETCSVIIVNSIRTYFQDYPGTCIKKVSITNNDQQTCGAIEHALKVAMGEVEVDEFDTSGYRVRKKDCLLTVHCTLSTHYELTKRSLCTRVRATEVVLTVCGILSPPQPQVVDYKWLWRENLGSASGKWIPYDESQNGKLEAEWKKKNQQVKANCVVGCHRLFLLALFLYRWW